MGLILLALLHNRRRLPVLVHNEIAPGDVCHCQCTRAADDTQRDVERCTAWQRGALRPKRNHEAQWRFAPCCVWWVLQLAGIAAMQHDRAARHHCKDNQSAQAQAAPMQRAESAPRQHCRSQNASGARFDRLRCFISAARDDVSLRCHRRDLQWVRLQLEGQFCLKLCLLVRSWVGVYQFCLNDVVQLLLRHQQAP